MLKFLKISLVPIMIVLLMAGCSTASVSEDDLVGSWQWNREDVWTYTFNEDGTGTRGDYLYDYHDFEWEIVRGELRIECPVAMFGVISERWRPSINGNTLTLESSQGGATFVYDRIN